MEKPSSHPKSMGIFAAVVIIAVILVILTSTPNNPKTAIPSADSAVAVLLDSNRAVLQRVHRGDYAEIDTVMCAVSMNDGTTVLMHAPLKYGSDHYLRLDDNEEVGKVKRIYRYGVASDAEYAAASYRYWNQ